MWQNEEHKSLCPGSSEHLEKYGMRSGECFFLRQSKSELLLVEKLNLQHERGYQDQTLRPLRRTS